MFRVLLAVGFRHYVHWLRSERDKKPEGGLQYGWMWAGLLILLQIGQVLCEHRLDWCGARLGHRWTQQARHTDPRLRIFFSVLFRQ